MSKLILLQNIRIFQLEFKTVLVSKYGSNHTKYFTFKKQATGKLGESFGAINVFSIEGSICVTWKFSDSLVPPRYLTTVQDYEVRLQCNLKERR